MEQERAQQLSERIINFIEVVGCGVMKQDTGEKMVELGDFMEPDQELTDFWGSMARVVAAKLGEKQVSGMARGELFKLVVFPLDNAHLGVKFPREESAWKIAAKMEPIVGAMK